MNDYQQTVPQPATSQAQPVSPPPNSSLPQIPNVPGTQNPEFMAQNLVDQTSTPNQTPAPKITDARTEATLTDQAVNQYVDSVNSSNYKEPPPRSNSSSQDEIIAEIEELARQVENTQNMPEELKERCYRNIDRLRRMAKRGSYSGEFESVDKYIYWATSIPWGKYTKDNLDIDNAKRIMDSTHYGMDTIKNLILDYLAVMQLKQNDGKTGVSDQAGSENMAVLRGSSANAPVFLFVGLQGVGKTSIAKSIATAMGRKFIRVSVGAVGSVQALRGQSKAFLDAEPGQIIKALVRSDSMNPVILLDEIDKASGNSGLLNDIMAALLEILDPEQNSTFQDHFMDYPVDLSKVFFICTANNLGSLSAALLDRMEVIRFTSYNDEEKTYIARNYTMPKVMKNMGLDQNMLQVQDTVWPILVRPVGFDAGLRQLERNIATMVRAAAREIVEGKPIPIVITPENVRDYVLPDQGPLS